MQNNTDYPDDAACIKSVTKLTRKNRKIDVIESAERLAIASIVHFHSTLVMNYLTADSLVLLYPRLTLERYWVVQDNVPQQNTWAPRYEGRNYQILVDAGVSPRYCNLFCRGINRFSSDRHCLLIPYDAGDDFETQISVEEPADDRMETDIAQDGGNFVWFFQSLCRARIGHDHCSRDICKLKLYLANHPASIVEYAARRAYCDM